MPDPEPREDHGPLKPLYPGFEPLRLETPDEAPEEAPRVELFSIDDQPFTIPVRVPQQVAVEYLHRFATAGGPEGQVLANDYLLTQVLGEDAYAALRAWPHLTTDQFAWVTEVITRLAFGQIEVPKGAGSA